MIWIVFVCEFDKSNFAGKKRRMHHPSHLKRKDQALGEWHNEDAR
ncbi:hypothetical protein THTE_0701 [Thermogutta terrifontis]|uniref:Uncharacterized protein n=1 Tax=Thermogutta terrifontis TaxID=1331910 RepID=A0A286RBG3_9BACT|nr:hypothetical protein THTE_0701 [Thermogutta terrifontis]